MTEPPDPAANEEVDKIVFRYSCVSGAVWLLLGIVGVIVTAVVFHFKYSTLSVTKPAIGLLIYLSCNLAGQRHRKLEISGAEVAYRPMFWSARRVKFTDVTSIERARLGRVHIPGMLLNRPDKLPLAIPLDLPNSDDVFEKITKTWEHQRATAAPAKPLE